MKKQDWSLAIATAFYSYIFYQQNAGLNFLLFSVCLTVLLAWSRPAVLRERHWQVAALCALTSGIFVFVHASWLAVLANCLSLLVLAGASRNRHSSVVVDLLSSGGSIAASPAFIAEDLYTSSQRPQQAERSYLKGLLVWVIPVALALLFFVIYRAANPLFLEFTKAINLDFVTFGWVMFTLGGLLVCSGLVRARRFAKVDKWEAQQQMNLSTIKTPVWNEKKAATILFFLLNAMLLLMNLLDINYLYLGAGLPDGITHKQFVHDGVGNLILSIVLGISVILYFFRGQLNFSGSKMIKWLVYAWIIQNLFMVLSTCIRNHIYIQEALLTYKRIGVFFWAALAAAGLLTTAYKILERRHAWFLIRSNSVFAIAVLASSSIVDWDKFVTDFNLARIGQIKDLDKRYLISLSETNLRQLYEIADDKGFEKNIYYHFDYHASYNNTERLNRKLASYLNHVHGTDWRSLSLRQARVLNDITVLNEQQKITTLDLTGLELKDLAAFSRLTNVRTIIFSGIPLLNNRMVAQLNSFKKLEHIDVQTLTYTDLLYFVKLNNLRSVRIEHLDKTALAFLRKQMPQTAFSVNQLTYRSENTADKGQ